MDIEINANFRSFVNLQIDLIFILYTAWESYLKSGVEEIALIMVGITKMKLWKGKVLRDPQL